MAKNYKQKNTMTTNKKDKKLILWILGTIFTSVIILIAWGDISFTGKEEKKSKSFYLKEFETRPVLEPSLFKGMVRQAYAAAKKYPELMNQVYCYCFCDRPPFNHKTLLSCFTDGHGAG